MPRDGSGIYTYPPGTPGIPDTTIESAKYNGYIADIQQDLNLPRPIVAGGTGATSAAGARDNLDAEVAGKQVTNYDTHIFENGSFWSDGSATAQPSPGWAVLGTSTTTANHVYLEARLTGYTPQPGPVYTRHKYNGVWGAWVVEGTSQFVEIAGDTMTGDLAINKSNPALNLNKTASSGQMAQIVGQRSGQARWGVVVGDDTAETGTDAGSNFGIYRNNDGGFFTGYAFTLVRATGNASFAGAVGVGVSGGTFPGYANTTVGFGVDPTGIFAVSRAVAVSAHFNINTDGANLQFSRSAVDVGSISCSTTATSFNTSSDERLKEDLKSFDAGNIIDDTNVYDFAWKSTGERSYGVIAQQAKDIYPHATFHEEKEDRWFIDYSKYVPVILQELKALRARVAELEARLEAKPA